MPQTVVLVGTRKGLFVLESERPPRLEHARALLRGLARLPGDLRPGLGNDLRGRRE